MNVSRAYYRRGAEQRGEISYKAGDAIFGCGVDAPARAMYVICCVFVSVCVSRCIVYEVFHYVFAVAVGLLFLRIDV